jgi:signal transduction histidine kinase/ActR/RegA family two-component response regulator
MTAPLEFAASVLPSDVAAEPESLDKRILTEQVESLLVTSQSVFYAGYLLAVAFAALFYWKTKQPSILAWLLLLNIWQIIRMRASRKYARTPIELRDPGQAARGYCYGNAVTSTFWGLMPWLFFPHGDITLTSIMMLVLMGIVSGGLGSVSPYRLAVFCLVIPVLTGLSTALLWQGDIVHIFLGLCALAYMALNLQLGLEQNRLINEALRARYENEALAHRLAEQVKIVERASLEKTRFFASASHDLRQPLHSLGLFGSTILSKLKDTPDEVLASNLMQCVDALEASFSSMLDVSKLDAGVVQVNAQKASLGDLFRRLQTSFGRQAESQGLSLRFKPGKKWVLTDSALLERLLGNLVHNSLKFTQRGGVVVLARTRGQRISIEVWDTGSGMDTHELPRIFDEFYQLGNRERDRSMGLGMGLAIVRRLSNLMTIPLEVKSRPKIGTVFKLLLPLVMPPKEFTHIPLRYTNSATLNALAGLRILVVDDEENVRASTAASLSLYGIHVEVADGIHHACEIAEQLEKEGRPLDVVISDFRLRNNEDGIALVEKIRALLGRQLPALLVTGDTAPERVRQAQQSGLRALYKPVKIHDLVEEIRIQVTK